MLREDFLEDALLNPNLGVEEREEKKESSCNLLSFASTVALDNKSTWLRSYG